MADNEDGAQSSATSTTEVSSPDSHLTASDIAKPPSEGSVSNSTSGEERAELVSRARAFLTSPQIKSQDILARRKFLSEKGLNDFEINGLLSELVSRLNISPVIPWELDTEGSSSLLKYLQFLHEPTHNFRPQTCPISYLASPGYFPG